MHPDDFNATRFYRTSKEAFGTQIYFERPSNDWIWAFGLFVAGILALGAWIWYRTQ